MKVDLSKTTYGDGDELRFGKYKVRASTKSLLTIRATLSGVLTM
jgi:hypothetical protein